MTEATTVYISVGSNMERERYVRKAVAMLRATFDTLVVSSVYETEAVGIVGDPFFNLAAGFTTCQAVEAVLESLRSIEQQCARVRDGADHGSRTMDIDLLLYGDMVSDGPLVVLPRREIKSRAFVLAPLAEIAGERIHPTEALTYAELWRRFDKSAQTIHRIDFPLPPQ